MMIPLISDYGTLLERASAKSKALPRPPASMKGRPLHEIRSWQVAEKARLAALPKVASVPKAAVKTATPAPPPWSREREAEELKVEFQNASDERRMEIGRRLFDLSFADAKPLPQGFESVTVKRARLENELAAAPDDETRFRLSRELMSL